MPSYARIVFSFLAVAGRDLLADRERANEQTYMDIVLLSEKESKKEGLLAPGCWPFPPQRRYFTALQIVPSMQSSK